MIMRKVLARGLNFASAPKCIPVAEIVASVEDGLRNPGVDTRVNNNWYFEKS